MQSSAFLILGCASFLQADGLDDLRTALSRMKGQGALQGTFEVNAWSRGGKGKDLEEATGAATVQVEEDATGFQIRWDPALLRRAEAEVKGKPGPQKNDSPALGIESASVLRLHAAMNAAPSLSRRFEGARLQQEGPDTWQGRPVRRLDLLLVPPPSETGDLKGSASTAMVWMEADGAPLAARLTHTIKTSKLFISVEMNRTEEFRFSVLSNRLVVLRQEESTTMKALGIDAQQRVITTFTAK